MAKQNVRDNDLWQELGRKRRFMLHFAAFGARVRSVLIRLTGGGIPDARSPVVSARNSIAVIGTKGGGIEGIFMLQGPS